MKRLQQLGIGLLAVVAFGLLPCTSAPLALGYFFGWPWGIGAFVLFWFGAAIFHGVVSLTPWRRKPVVVAPEAKEKTDDVS